MNSHDKKDVIKPSGAIQIVVTDKKKLSLTQRKAWNILIVAAQADLDSQETYSINIVDIKRQLRFHDISLKTELIKLMSTTVQFNYLKSRDQSVWEASTLLADATIEGNVLSYSFGPLMRKKLSNHEFYARINLAIQSTINSKYTLILYELGKDHFISSKGIGQSPFIEIKDLKMLLDCLDEKSYERFAAFSRMLKKSIDEVNSKTEIFMTPVYKRTGRKVSAVQFKIRANTDKSGMLDGLFGPRQTALPFEHNDLYRLMVDQFGLNPNVAIGFLKDYREEHIRRNIAYTVSQRAKGKVSQSLAGFLRQAIIDDYAGSQDPAAVSLLPEIKPGMSIDVGKGKIFKVDDDLGIRHERGYYPTNIIRQGLLDGKFHIVEYPAAEPEYLPPKHAKKGDKEAQQKDDASDIGQHGAIPPGTKIDIGGVIWTVADDSSIKNNYGETIMDNDGLQEYLKKGFCSIVEEKG